MVDSDTDEISIGVFVSEIEEYEEPDESTVEGWRGVTRRDKYGFELEAEYSEPHMRHAMRSSNVEEETQSLWRKLFISCNHFTTTPPSSKLHSLIRKYGIPTEYRGQVSNCTILYENIGTDVRVDMVVYQ